VATLARNSFQVQVLAGATRVFRPNALALRLINPTAPKTAEEAKARHQEVI
jgi:hypothetical protein